MGRLQDATTVRHLPADRIALVLANLDLPAKVAGAERIFAARDQGVVDRDDLEAAGRLGLCEAAVAYDPAAGDFAVYAYTATKRRMRREVALARWRGHAASRPSQAQQAQQGARLESLDDLPADVRDRVGEPAAAAEQVVLRVLDRRRVRAALDAMVGQGDELALLRSIVIERWWLEQPLAVIAQRHRLTVRQVHNRLAAACRWLAVVVAADDPRAADVLAAAARAATGHPTRADRERFVGAPTSRTGRADRLRGAA